MSLVSNHWKQELGQGIDRQGERECASASGFTHGPHSAAVESDDFFGNVKPETEAGSVAIYRVGVLIETFKNLPQRLLRNATTTVGDREIDRNRVRLYQRDSHDHRSGWG